MKVVLMAGGRGTRISELFPDVPKPLIPIQNMPVLEREIISLREQGFTEIILTVGYMADKIKDYFGDGSRLGVKINYFVEDKPLGNAGALFFLDLIEDFLLLNADAIFDVDFNRMVKYHRRKGALVTLFTHPNSHPYDSGLIIADKSGEVKQWLTKEESRPKYYKNRVNAGLHVISPKALEMSGIDKNSIGKEIDEKIVKVDLDRQILKPLCSTGKMKSKIPYSIYYFSRNMEHVLHNVATELTDDQKIELADAFADRYEENPMDFVAFIESEEVAVPGGYTQTWTFIREGTNSLNRHSNLRILFEQENLKSNQ